MCKILPGPFLEGRAALCNLLSCMQVCSTRPTCHVVNLQCFLDWKAEDGDLHLKERCKYLELSASMLLIYLPVAGFLLKLKVQSRTQEETVLLFRKRLISPYLSEIFYSKTAV